LIALVLGGARSGKSEVAERLATGLPQPVLYVATMHVGEDTDLASRIEAHRSRRPTTWKTLEADHRLPAMLRKLSGTVLLDALGGWVASCPDMEVDTSDLASALLERGGDTVLVSEEVGMGVHPSTESGRRFRDALGSVNRAVSDVADEVLLVVAGRTLHLAP
jgi:adenosyl cobinamide kinase/adenosyl cobinamide phosphate guanylyltransferase